MPAALPRAQHAQDRIRHIPWMNYQYWADRWPPEYNLSLPGHKKTGGIYYFSVCSSRLFAMQTTRRLMPIISCFLVLHRWFISSEFLEMRFPGVYGDYTGSYFFIWPQINMDKTPKNTRRSKKRFCQPTIAGTEPQYFNTMIMRFSILEKPIK